MGIFDNFPYTNFHELNLDWMLNQLRGIDHKLDEALDLIKNKIADLVDDPAIKEKIDEIIAEYLTPEQIEEITEQVITDITDVLKDTPYVFPFVPYAEIQRTKFPLLGDTINKTNQGMCCDGQYVYSYRPNSAYNIGAGSLDKFNMNGYVDQSIQNWTHERSNSIDLGHGNGLFYRRDNDRIYATALFSGDPQLPDRRVFIVNPHTLQIEDTFELDLALMGLCYNEKLKRWVGFSNEGGSYFLYWDEDFNLIDTQVVTQHLNNRVGIFADDDYIYLMSTGSYGTFVAGQYSEARISVYDWYKNYRGDIVFHNGEELEAMAWTGKQFIVSFTASYGSGYRPYVSLIQLTPKDYMPYQFYRTHWGQNQLLWQAMDDNDMILPCNLNPIPAYDKRVTYTATHLELEFAWSRASAPQLVIVPRAYGLNSKTTYHTIVHAGAANTYTQTIRIEQENGEVRFGAECYGTRESSSTGEITRLDNNDAYFKLVRARACNYTMQGMGYNSWLLEE